MDEAVIMNNDFVRLLLVSLRSIYGCCYKLHHLKITEVLSLNIERVDHFVWQEMVLYL